MYLFVKLGDNHDIRLLCKGNGTSVHPVRVINLCDIEEATHLVLLKELHKLIRSARPRHYSKNVFVNGVFRKICSFHIKNEHYNRHFNQCDKFKS